MGSKAAFFVISDHNKVSSKHSFAKQQRETRLSVPQRGLLLRHISIAPWLMQMGKPIRLCETQQGTTHTSSSEKKTHWTCTEKLLPPSHPAVYLRKQQEPMPWVSPDLLLCIRSSELGVKISMQRSGAPIISPSATNPKHFMPFQGFKSESDRSALPLRLGKVSTLQTIWLHGLELSTFS